MIASRVLKVAWCGLAVALLVACSSSDDSNSGPGNGSSGAGSGGSGSGGSGGSGSIGPGGDDCIEGLSCDCEPGWQGTATCVDGEEVCNCEECPALEVVEAPELTSCGGEPFGTWRLSQLEFGAVPIELSVNGSPVGSCDGVFNIDGDLPRVLMDLKDGGTAQYLAETAAMTQSWSDSCVTSKVSQFYCDSSVWSGVTNCELDCDICTCDSGFNENDEPSGEWARTSSTLELAPWGTPTTFEYCVEAEQLKLSAGGAYMVFDRVYTLSAPTPCAERTPETCMLGEFCSLGGCGGGDGCETVSTEEDCLTYETCTWDPNRCAGQDQYTCGLADFGTVPGCEFVDEARACTGQPTACATLDVASCETIPGCELETGGRCTGPSLACADFDACPIGYCNDDGGECTGSTSCAAFESEDDCAEANENFPTAPCVWEESYCEGTPTPCSSYSQEECAAVPGCQLAPAP
jgi:hypothetical protein